jgi:hypothetical protein
LKLWPIKQKHARQSGSIASWWDDSSCDAVLEDSWFAVSQICVKSPIEWPLLDGDYCKHRMYVVRDAPVVSDGQRADEAMASPKQTAKRAHRNAGGSPEVTDQDGGSEAVESRQLGITKTSGRLVLGSCWCKGDFSTTIALSAPTPWVTDHRATVQYSSVPLLFVTACFVTAFGYRSIVTNRGKQASSLGCAAIFAANRGQTRSRGCYQKHLIR